jgi:hypothetical protein
MGIPSPQGNVSKLGLDLDNIICLVPRKNVKLSKLAFSFAPSYSELKIFW